jgi:hypothetical protein
MNLLKKPSACFNPIAKPWMATQIPATSLDLWALATNSAS